jgi:hypothetical protein
MKAAKKSRSIICDRSRSTSISFGISVFWSNRFRQKASADPEVKSWKIPAFEL